MCNSLLDALLEIEGLVDLSHQDQISGQNLQETCDMLCRSTLLLHSVSACISRYQLQVSSRNQSVFLSCKVAKCFSCAGALCLGLSLQRGVAAGRARQVSPCFVYLVLSSSLKAAQNSCHETDTSCRTHSGSSSAKHSQLKLLASR